jgi:VanZ family protein
MKWLAILFALFIALIILLADMGTLPRYLGPVYRFPYADKVGHFILYGILTLLIDLAPLRPLSHQSRRRVAVMSALILALLIGLEELSQQYFSSRTFSLGDLTASYLGVMFFTWVGIRVGEKNNPVP